MPAIIQVPAQCSAPVPTFTTVAPGCSSPTGSVTVTSPLGANYVYSLYLVGNPIVGPQASPVFSGLAAGNYVIIVQDNTTNCCNTNTFTLTAATAPAAPTGTVTQPSCTVTTGSITITSPVGAGFQYSINGAPYQASPIFTGLAPGATYNITVQNAAGCPSATTPFVVNALPPNIQAPVVSVTQPTCTTPTGTITVTAPLGAGLLYSIGGPFQASPIFTGLGQNVYNVVVQNGPGCISQGTSANVNAAPTVPVAPTGTITQPTCTVNTGTITITAPVGAGLQYSLNGGAYQSSPVFGSLVPNSYTITVQNAGGCTSPASQPFVVAAPPAAPVAPTGTITQPNCTTPTGTITITAPVGAGLQYSINGGTYQASPVFGNLIPNSYTITVQNAGGCTSPASQPFVVAAPPAAPVAPTGTITQPNCTTITGSITITAPVGAGFQYSINGGPYQASPIFSGLNPNSYTITVQNAGGCTSPASQPFVLNTPAAVPLVASATQPDCNNSTGTITITSPIGSNYIYGIRNTATSVLTGPQASPVFMNVTPGQYIILGQSTNNTTCLSGNAITINAAPPVPVAPTGTITQPTCTTATGTITITSPLGAGLQYSLNGGAYQSSPVFGSLVPNSYTLTVQITGGCTSPVSQPFVLAAPAGAPAAPTGTIAQPTCTTLTGTITITAPVGTGLQYSINGGAYQNSPIFAALTPNSYTITAQNAAGCTSTASQPFVINAPQLQPAKPAITVVQPACPVLTGTITVTSPVGSNIEYSRNGTTYQSSNVFLNVPAGNYNITARFTGTTCVSTVTNTTITRLTAADCTTGTDIYFPSAFTPDGDGLNETFGPGPRSSLALVTNYTLLVYNRYGELVYKSNNPLQQWNGSYKGKVSGNFTYTWTATYRFNGRPLQTKKGTVTIVR
ncbi:MAG: gliding motility-associated C-terminal domain-containing protein [Sphingobacteriales bacterium]|nr:MAG: gliding motility-associated C-terminal domain-containing protein [Sphingobacteriales bacterium]